MFDHVKVVVLDEADRMLDMGFLSAVEGVMSHSTMVPISERQTLMFSATFPEEIQRLAGKFLRDYIFITVGIVGGACTDVTQSFFALSRFDKRKKLIEILQSEEAQGTMIFVETKRNADFLASVLSETKIPTTSIHGDRLQRQREEALNDFKTGRMKVLIGTSVAARGLGKCFILQPTNHLTFFNKYSHIFSFIHRHPECASCY